MNRFWISAGVLNLIVAFMHLIMGYDDPLKPLLATALSDISVATILAVWAMATVILFFSSAILLYMGLYPQQSATQEFALFWGVVYFLFALVFIVLNIAYGFFSLAQGVLLLPIGLLAIYGRK